MWLPNRPGPCGAVASRFGGSLCRSPLLQAEPWSWPSETAAPRAACPDRSPLAPARLGPRVLWRYGLRSGDGALHHPSLALPLPGSLIAVNDDYRNRVVLISLRTKRIVWQYGHSDVAGAAPGILSSPSSPVSRADVFATLWIGLDRATSLGAALRRAGRLLEAIAQGHRLAVASELGERLVLNLADALAREAEPLADLFEGAGTLARKTKP